MVAEPDPGIVPKPCRLPAAGRFRRRKGRKCYELKNHLGNVLVVISDRKLGIADPQDSTVALYYEAEVLSLSDYYPFGMQQPGRSYSAGVYRYGFNGMEADDEVKGTRNSYTTLFRQLDPRLGRWLSVDPKANLLPHESPYLFAHNSPVIAYDPNGDFPWIIIPIIVGFMMSPQGAHAPSQPGMGAEAEKTVDSWRFTFLSGAAIPPAVKGGTSLTKWAFANPVKATALGGTVASALDPNPYADYTLMLPGDEVLGNAIGQGLRSLSQTKLARYTSQQLGNMGEYMLEMIYKGSKKTFKTSLGLRYVDNFVDGVAYEAKVGYKSATEFHKKQFAKDLELLADPESGINEVVWTFFRSPQTGKVRCV